MRRFLLRFEDGDVIEGVQFSDGTFALNVDLAYTVYPGIPIYANETELLDGYIFPVHLVWIDAIDSKGEESLL